MAEVFVGRVTEQDEFRRVLQLARPRGRWRRRGTDGPDEGHVVLLYGLGGIGKTTLLRRLRDIAGEPRESALVAGIVDCETQRQRHPEEYAGLDGPPIWRLLDQLYGAVREGADGRRGLESRVNRAFETFRQLMGVQPQLMQRAAALGIGAAFGRRRLSAEEIKAIGQSAGGVADIAALAVPGAGSFASPLAQTVGATVSAIAHRRDSGVDTAAYDALLVDLDRLVRSFADALREVSRRSGPLVMFIDTGELLGGALEWLREATRRSGSNVIWVLGLRLEAASDAGTDSEAVQFRRFIHDTRLRQIALTSFDDRTVEQYLRGRLGPDYPEGLDISAVVRLTRGIPLAVSLAADPLASEQDPAAMLMPISDGNVSLVIRELARRYLVHARKSPALKPDLPLLFGLALLYGEDRVRPDSRSPEGGYTSRSHADPYALAALWDTSADQVRTHLDGLAARHDFVLSGRRRLHQEVREAILLYLLDATERLAVRAASERAAAYFRGQADRAGHLTVDAQIADPHWQTAVTALLWHTFWIDLDQGLQMLQEVFTTAVSLDDAFAAGLLQVAESFAPVCPTEGQRLINGLRWLSSSPTAKASLLARDTVKTLADCPAGPLLAPAPSSAVYRDLLRLRFHAQLGLNTSELAAMLLRAAAHVQADSATARAIASAAGQLAMDRRAYDLAPSDTQQAIISALGLTTRFNPGDATAHNRLGNQLYNLYRFTLAEAAYREALRIDPYYVAAHNNLGYALANLGRFTDAEDAYRKALSFDPDYARAHCGLGYALATLGRFTDAEDVCREALRIDPDYVAAHYVLGYALVNLGRFTDAEDAYRKALSFDPYYTRAHCGLGHALANLGRFTDAEDAYRKALSFDPCYSAAHAGLGWLYLNFLGKTNDAEAELREALRIDPDRVGPHANLGLLYIMTGDLEAARLSFASAIQSAHHAKPLVAELMLGALDDSGDPSAAEGHFKAVLEAINSPQPTILSPFRRAEIHALALVGLGRAEEAGTVFSAAVNKLRFRADVFRKQQYELFDKPEFTPGINILLAIWRDSSLETNK